MAFPPVCLAHATFTLTAVTTGHREVSPYTFKQTAYDFGGGMWRASLDLFSMRARDRATFLRWLVSLRGQIGTFEMKVLDYDGPFGTMSANPTIATAANARASTITVTLASGSAVSTDDQITIDGHLHVVTNAAPKSGDTQVLTIWPSLRAPVAVDDVVEALDPYCTWALASPENGFSLSRRLNMNTTLDLIEAI